ncbi:MAG: PEP-CTERM sorting domain-containing protein [Planctomycetales bacterium]|nr:PEP-CTERM sorting domain-containing protein [Planctomycetales bacterium]
MTPRTIRSILAGKFVATLWLSLIFTGPASASTILIDDFVTPQSVTATASSPVAFSSVPAPEAIGGERDMELSLTGGFTSLSLSSNPFGGELLVHDSGATVTGSSVAVWDGPDANSAINYTGLGGVDLSTGLDAFMLNGLIADLAGEISVTVFDASDATGGTSSTSTLSLPGGMLVPTDVALPYASFTLAGINGAADFANIGAIRLAISNETSGSLDVLIGSITAVPEPSSALGLITACFAGLGMLRRR